LLDSHLVCKLLAYELFRGAIHPFPGQISCLLHYVRAQIQEANRLLSYLPKQLLIINKYFFLWFRRTCSNIHTTLYNKL